MTGQELWYGGGWRGAAGWLRGCGAGCGRLG